MKSIYWIHSLFHVFALLFKLLDPEQKREFIWLGVRAFFLSLFEMSMAASVFPYLATLRGETPFIVLKVSSALDFSPVALFSIGLFALLSIKIYIEASLSWKLAGFNQGVQRSTTMRLLRGYLHMEWSNFKSRHNAEYLKFCTSNAVDAAFASNQCISILASALVILLLTGLMLWQNTTVSLLLIAGFFTVNIISHRLIGAPQRQASHNREAAIRRSHVGITEAFASFRELRVYGAEQYFLENISKETAGLFQANRRLSFFPIIPGLALDYLAMAALLSVVTFWLFSDLVLSELLPSLVFYAVVARAMLPAMIKLLGTRTYINGSILNINLVLKEFDTSRKHHLPRLSVTCKPAPEGCYCFYNVSYSYDADTPPILENVSFRLPHPSWTAIVGPSGSGKSTLMELLCSVQSPIAGSVEFEWPDIGGKGDSPCIAYLPQHVAMLDSTVKENVVFGYDPGNDEDVFEALRLAQLWTVVESLPQGIFSQVGSDGARLSGGERQRLAIARALYRHPDLLLLDEATSALDESTETMLFSGISKERPLMSVVYITHRSSNLVFAHRIFNLLNGRLGVIPYPFQARQDD